MKCRGFSQTAKDDYRLLAKIYKVRFLRIAAVGANCSEGRLSAYTDEMCLVQQSDQFPLPSLSLTAQSRPWSLLQRTTATI